jgi:hypothetical protein
MSKLNIKQIELVIDERELNWLGDIHRMKEERREIQEVRPQGKNKRIKVRQEAAK